jgi:hypothetical protein
VASGQLALLMWKEQKVNNLSRVATEKLPFPSAAIANLVAIFSSSPPFLSPSDAPVDVRATT